MSNVIKNLSARFEDWYREITPRKVIKVTAMVICGLAALAFARLFVLCFRVPDSGKALVSMCFGPPFHRIIYTSWTGKILSFQAAFAAVGMLFSALGIAGSIAAGVQLKS